jgi:hypothetical protein
MNLERVSNPKKVLDAILKSATSNYMFSLRKFSDVPKVTGRKIRSMGVVAAPGTLPWKGAHLICSRDLGNPIWLKVFRNKMFKELPPLTRTRLSLTY